MDMNLSKLPETVEDRVAWHTAWGCKESDLETEQQQQNDLFLINWQFFMAEDVISFGIYSMGIWKKKSAIVEWSVV